MAKFAGRIALSTRSATPPWRSRSCSPGSAATASSAWSTCAAGPRPAAVPTSRGARCPHSLEAEGIAYVWRGDLGGYRKPAPESPNGAWRVAAFRAYADFMLTPEFDAAIGQVGAARRGSPDRADVRRGRPMALPSPAPGRRLHRPRMAGAPRRSTAGAPTTRSRRSPARRDPRILYPASAAATMSSPGQPASSLTFANRSRATNMASRTSGAPT